jgi:hypothetical protein
VPERGTLGTWLSLVKWGLPFVAAVVLVLLIWGIGRSWATNSVHRAEVEAREVHLYQQLSNRDGVLESQRRIYIERIRKLEAQIRQKEQEISALRTRSSALSPPTAP